MSQEKSFIDKANTQTIDALDAVLSDVAGGLAPFDPYLHWSLNCRSHFYVPEEVTVVREYHAGLHVLMIKHDFYVARKFMNTNGWFWSCVAIRDAEADNRMLHSMMDGNT